MDFENNNNSWNKTENKYRRHYSIVSSDLADMAIIRYFYVY